MVVSRSRTTQSAGSASRFAPGKGGGAGRGAGAAWFVAGAGGVGAWAQARPGSSTSKAARNLNFIGGILLVDPLHVQAPAFKHGLDRDPSRQMAGADREQHRAGSVEPAGQPVGEIAVAAGDQALVELGRQRLHLRGDAVEIAVDPVALVRIARFLAARIG